MSDTPSTSGGAGGSKKRGPPTEEKPGSTSLPYHKRLEAVQALINPVGPAAVRPGKYLLVLDVDDTIYDARGLEAGLAARPYLEYLLTNLYEEYDFIVWSATSANYIYEKLVILNMVNHSRFKLLCCFDINTMTSVRGLGSRKKIKNLKEIWDRYPMYNSNNTLLCDDQAVNFMFHQRNGVQVAPYSYVNHDTDDEFLKLTRYLMYALTFPDVKQMEHNIWREFISS